MSTPMSIVPYLSGAGGGVLPPVGKTLGGIDVWRPSELSETVALHPNAMTIEIKVH